MTLEEGRNQLAAALRTASDEHGRPNSFTARELYESHGGPRPMLAGRIGKRYIVNVWQVLGGSQKWGSCPVYHGGRFYV